MNKGEKQEKWAADRVQYIRGLKSPNEQQRLMVFLTDKTNKTVQENKGHEPDTVREKSRSQSRP